MEVILAVTVICFLAGFILVLCIGNYFRAKRAMERQRQRRLMTRLTNNGKDAVNASPRSAHSSATSGGSTRSGEHQHLLAKPPELPRRRNPQEEGHDLLLFPDDQQQQQSIPKVMSV
jgi:hypothetical protein